VIWFIGVTAIEGTSMTDDPGQMVDLRITLPFHREDSDQPNSGLQIRTVKSRFVEDSNWFFYL
jgi:hypothetical protein